MEKEEKTYECVCGKVFYDSQKFNGHKSQCKEHQIQKYGDLNHYHQARKRAAQASGRIQHEKYLIEKQYLYENWVSEQHRCERCGKIMTEYYGSGRFCSRGCANSRAHSNEEKDNISRAYYRHLSSNLSEQEIETRVQNNKISREQRKHRFVYNGPELPTIERKNGSNKGYQNRAEEPVSEQFWRKVLDANHIPYERNVPVWKPGLNNYYLDFLINGNIDLEIDGKLHTKPDIIQKDMTRTLYLEGKGYIVYRIKWVDPITDNKKAIVNQQIEDLLNFLNTPRLK